MLSIELQPANTLSPPLPAGAYCNELGIETTFKFAQEEKALEDMLSMPSGRINVSIATPVKASIPIERRLFPNLIFDN